MLIFFTKRIQFARMFSLQIIDGGVGDFKRGLRHHAGKGVVVHPLVIFVRPDDIEDFIAVLVLLEVGVGISKNARIPG